MNIHSKAIRILCYGDSNTWGQNPKTNKRYDAVIRWTGRLQKILGEDFEIIEEGLNARTTVIDDPKHVGKNGATYLKPCMQTHSPLNIVVVMLGTNDLKERFSRIPEQIADGIDTLVSIIHNSEYNYRTNPKVILISPPYVDESVKGVQENYQGAEEKSKQLGRLYKNIADKYKSEFIDSAKYVSSSKIDGFHLDAEAHKKIAELLAEKIKDMALTQQS